MEILILAALIGLIPAAIAKGKGHSFALWWIYGAALFIIALPHSLIMKEDHSAIEKKQLSEGMKKCPHCAELVKSEAIVCKHCGRDLPAVPQTLEAKQAEVEPAYTAADYVRDNKKKLMELCKKLNSKSLSFYEYQLLAPAAGATVGLVSGTFSTKYSITHHDETLVFNRVKELRPWFQSNVVPLLVGKA